MIPKNFSETVTCKYRRTSKNNKFNKILVSEGIISTLFSGATLLWVSISGTLPFNRWRVLTGREGVCLGKNWLYYYCYYYYYLLSSLSLSLSSSLSLLSFNYYYSFKIFPQFWLAKSTRIIHHNQLLMTKFGRILCLTRKWREKCSVLAG